MSYASVKQAFEKRSHAVLPGVIVFEDSRHRRSHKSGFVAAEFYPEKARSVFIGSNEPQERTGTYDFVVRETSNLEELERLDEIQIHFPTGLILAENDLKVSVGIGEIRREKKSNSSVHYRLKVNWRTFF